MASPDTRAVLRSTGRIAAYGQKQTIAKQTSMKQSDRRRLVGLAYDQVVVGYGRIRWMHIVAFLSVALTFYARHASGYFTSCVKTCGMAGLLGSMVVWWPIGLSWIVVRQFPTLAVSRGWQATFVLTNVAICILYGWVSWDRYMPFLVTSAVHALVLAFSAFILSAAKPEK